MLKEKDAFFRFVNGFSCSPADFNLVLRYFKHADFQEKGLFYQRQKSMVFACLREMIKQHSTASAICQKIYQNLGISDYYFQSVFHFIIHSYADDELVKTYCAMLQEEKAEKIFEEAKQALWENQKLNKIAKQNHLSISQVEQFLADYAIQHYHISFDDFKQYKSCYRNFRRFLALEKINYSQKRKAYYYYQNYASKEEKEEFLYVVQNYLVKIIRISHKPQALDAFLEEANLSDYDVYLFTTIQSIDINVKERLFFRFKKYYDGCLKYNFSVVDIKKDAYHLSANEYIHLARVYAKEVLHIEAPLEKIVEKHYTKPVYEALKTIQDETDLAKIEQVLYDENVKTIDISVFCYCVNANITKEEQQRLEKKLLECLKVVHTRRVAEGQKKVAITPTDYSLYYEYLNQELNFMDFCKQKGISFKNFRYAYKVLKNPELANKLEERIKKESANHVNMQIYWCKELILAIQNGINIHGINRKFNLFDYFYYFGEYQIHQFFIPKLPLPQPEKTILNKFFAPLKKANYLNLNTFLNSMYEFRPKLDKKGTPIKGSGRVLSREELQEIADIFETKNIPFNDILLNIATRCYANGSLIEEMPLQRK